MDVGRAVCFEDASKIDLICHNFEDHNPTNCSTISPLSTPSHFVSPRRRTFFQQKRFYSPSEFEKLDPNWFVAPMDGSLIKPSCSSSMSDSSLGYGSYHNDTLKSSPSSVEEERYSFSSTDNDYYSGSGANSSGASSISCKTDRGIEENYIDSLFIQARDNAEFYDLENIIFEPEESQSHSQSALIRDSTSTLDEGRTPDFHPENEDCLDDVVSSLNSARTNITEMAEKVLSMISELKLEASEHEGTLDHQKHSRRSRSPPSKELASIPENYSEKSDEHIYQEIQGDSREVNLLGVQPPPLPKRNYHSSLITMPSHSHQGSSWSSIPQFRQSIRRSLPPLRRCPGKSLDKLLPTPTTPKLGRERRRGEEERRLGQLNNLLPDKAVSLNSVFPKRSWRSSRRGWGEEKVTPLPPSREDGQDERRNLTRLPFDCFPDDSRGLMRERKTLHNFSPLLSPSLSEEHLRYEGHHHPTSLSRSTQV